MKYVERLRSILTDVDLAYVFGSHASGAEDEYSDLDILIVKDTAKDFFYRFQEFQGLYELGVPIDLLIYTPQEFKEMQDNHNPFIEDIIRNGVRII